MAELAAVGAGLRDDAYLFSNDPAHARLWNPNWVTPKVADAADAARVELDIKGGRHYTASQRRPGPRGGPPRRRLPRAAQLTAGSATQSS